MSSMVETINSALAAIGPSTEGRLKSILAEFSSLCLSLDERLSVLATTIAHAATVHHGGHKAVYLEAVRVWSVEIAMAVEPPPPRRGSGASDDGTIDDGVELLVSGFDSLVESMSLADIGLQNRLVTELALLARLLGEHDANTIHITLMAVDRALAGSGYRTGNHIAVSLYETSRPVTRETPLAALLPRGLA